MDSAFFVVSKLAAPLLQLETWLFLLLLATFVLLRFGRAGAATGTAGIAAALLALVSILPLGSLVLNALEARFPPNPDPSDVAGIVILGGGEDSVRSAEWDQPLVNDAGDRFIAALVLANRYPDAQVLFTGGIGSIVQSGPTGAEVAGRLLLESGLSPDRLMLEPASRNTWENARFALEHRTEKPGVWILVTSAFHMPRAVESFCAAGWTDVVPWPTDYRGQAFLEGIAWDLPAHLQALETAVREVVGLRVYRLTGRATKAAGCLAEGFGSPSAD